MVFGFKNAVPRVRFDGKSKVRKSKAERSTGSFCTIYFLAMPRRFPPALLQTGAFTTGRFHSITRGVFRLRRTATRLRQLATPWREALRTQRIYMGKPRMQERTGGTISLSNVASLCLRGSVVKFNPHTSAAPAHSLRSNIW